MNQTEACDLILHHFQGNPEAYLLMDDPDGEGLRTVHSPGAGRLQEHLEGTCRIGFFPFAEDDRVKWGAIDIDTGCREDLVATSSVLDSMGISHHIEVSKSKGWHLWLFVDFVPAYKVRQVLAWVVQQAGVTAEVFPKQDAPETTGNGVWLPWCGHLAKGSGNRCKFVGAEGQELDQGTVLASIRPVNESELDDLLYLHDIPPPEPEGDIHTPAPRVGEKIKKGSRNETLTSLGGTMRRRGMSQEAIEAALLVENATKCDPRLDESEVRAIAASVGRYPPEPDGGQSSSSPYIHDDGDDGPVAFHPIPFSQLLAEAPDVTWLVDHILPTGTSAVLGADPNTGKSFLQMELAVAVATGTPWLGQFKATQGSVLVIDSENSLPDLRRRGLKLLRGRGLPEEGDLPIEYLVGSSMNLSDQRHVVGLEALLADRSPALVLIDSLVRVHGASENSATEMAAVFAELKRILDTFGCTVLFTHHSRKMGMFNASGQMLRGSTEIRAFVDTSLFLRKVGEALRVEHDKARHGEPVPNFVVEIVDPPEIPDSTVVRYVGEAQGEGEDRSQQAEEFLLTLLAQGGQFRQDILKLAKEMELSETTIDRAMKALIETRQVKREQRGSKAFFTLLQPSSSSSDHIGDDDGSEDQQPDFEEVEV